jgi:dihydroorotate dehydrogenase (fumarate)
MDLTTTYCGLTLKSPLMTGASPLPKRLDRARRLEDAGASAIVMWSLFEEQLVHEEIATVQARTLPAESYPEALTYLPNSAGLDVGPDEYLATLAEIKRAVSVPVFGSLNGTSATGWTDYAALIEQAGADGLELNAYEFTFGSHTSAQIEDHLVELVGKVREATTLPIAVKLLPYFAGLPALCGRLREAGADAVVLFNRTYEPSIDIEELEMDGAYPLSEPGELSLRLRWLGLISGKRLATGPIDLACSGGVHTTEDAIRALMCGATVVQVVSALIRRDVEWIGTLSRELDRWLDEHDYASLDQLRGSMDSRRCPDPWAYTRQRYIRTLHNHAL